MDYNDGGQKKTTIGDRGRGENGGVETEVELEAVQWRIGVDTGDYDVDRKAVQRRNSDRCLNSRCGRIDVDRDDRNRPYRHRSRQEQYGGQLQNLVFHNIPFEVGATRWT